MQEDHLALENEVLAGEAMLKPCMREGKRLRPPVTLEQHRKRAARQLVLLPEHLRSLKPAEPYPVHLSKKIRDLAERLDKPSS